MSQYFNNFIGGKWVDPTSGEFFENKNPSDINETIGLFPRSGKADIGAAVSAASAAFDNWRNIPPHERAKIIFEAGRIMSGRKKELAEIISKENGKTVKSAMGDVQSAIDMSFFIGGEGYRWYGKTAHSALPQRFAMTKRYPIGVVGLIPSWNFPMGLAGWRVFPALFCGNTVVMKSEENTPESAHRITEILDEAGLPKGVLNLVHGLGSEAGDALVNHPGVSMISFTGSSKIGSLIGVNCLKKLAKTSLELGGKNAVIVMNDADIDLAVNGVAAGAFSLSGQRCTATSRLILQDGIYDFFMEKLISATAKLKIGPGSDDASDVTPLIGKVQYERVLNWIEQAKKDGAKVIRGGEKLEGGVYDKGYYINPTIIIDAPPDSAIAQEEIFGPVLVVFRAQSFDEAVKIANNARYGLSASLFTKDLNKAFTFFDNIQTGVCYINAPTYGGEPHMPFGGVKDSGLGYREVGWAGVEAYSEVKSIYVDYSAKIQTIQEKK